jgi:hypothetical protein
MSETTPDIRRYFPKGVSEEHKEKFLELLQTEPCISQFYESWKDQLDPRKAMITKLVETEETSRLDGEISETEEATFEFSKERAMEEAEEKIEFLKRELENSRLCQEELINSFRHFSVEIRNYNESIRKDLRDCREFFGEFRDLMKFFEEKFRSYLFTTVKKLIHFGVNFKAAVYVLEIPPKLEKEFMDEIKNESILTEASQKSL